MARKPGIVRSLKIPQSKFRLGLYIFTQPNSITGVDHFHATAHQEEEVEDCERDQQVVEVALETSPGSF